MLRLDDLRAADHEAFRQPRAHRLGDVGHGLEIGDAAVVEPVEHLLGAQLGGLGVEARFLEEFADARAGEADEVDATIGARRDVARGGHRVDEARDGHECGIGHDCARI